MDGCGSAKVASRRARVWVHEVDRAVLVREVGAIGAVGRPGGGEPQVLGVARRRRALEAVAFSALRVDQIQRGQLVQGAVVLDPVPLSVAQAKQG